MKVVWHIVAIGLIGITCYLAGKASIGQAEKVEPDQISVPKQAATGPPSPTDEVRKLLVSNPTDDQTIAIKHAVLGMTVPQLRSLWNSQNQRFDYHNKNDAALAASILTGMAALDPNAAMNCLPDTGAAKYAMLPAILRGWAKHDRDEALSWIRSSNDPRARHACMAAVVEEVGMSDREEAFALFASAVKDKVLPSQGWDSSSFFSKWVREDPDQALGQALNHYKTTRDSGAILSAVGTWSRIDGDAAAQWITANTSSKLLSRAYGPLLDGWVETAPRDAADFLLQIENKEDIGGNLEDLLTKWTALDAEGMRTWAEELTNPQHLAAFEKAMERANTDAGREIGIDSLKQLDRPDMREAFLEEARFFARKDPFAALAWGKENLQGSELLDGFNARALNSLSWQAPDQAAQHLTMLTDENGERSRLFTGTAERWGNQDPQSAREWVEQLKPGKDRDAAIVGLAEGWIAKNRERQAADKWINEVLPESGEMRDQLLNRLAYGSMIETGSDESARALAYAEQIENPYYRDETYEVIIKKWSEAHDRKDAAIQFARESDQISDTVRWRVLDARNAAQ